MARVTVEDCLDKVENRFLLVMLASKRVKQLYKGVKPMIDPKNNRLVVTALREIAASKVTYEVIGKKQRAH
ncbi:MAG TPA: DNA-directed RNA polymerase subunit omega [Desulfuromonadaceae bacterium]|jgi:DNA-directed RNA polymerase subunit omega